jgi:hypothetical protein
MDWSNQPRATRASHLAGALAGASGATADAAQNSKLCFVACFLKEVPPHGQEVCVAD